MEKELALTEAELKVVRKEFYRGIAEDIYTGYNVYNKPYTLGQFSLEYFHSDLTPRHKHFRELKRILINQGFLQPATTIEARKLYGFLDRKAVYLTLQRWRKAKRGRRFSFFTVDGEEISYKEAQKMDVRLISEAREYNLVLTAKKEDELKDLLDLFKNSCFRFKIDGYGSICRDEKDKEIENKKAIYGSDDIPLITTKTRLRNRKDLVQIIQFDIPFSVKEKKLIVSSLVPKENVSKLKRYLLKRNLDSIASTRYAIRAFVADYLL